MIDQEAATELVKTFLDEALKIQLHSSIPAGTSFYDVDADKEYLIRFKLFGRPAIGAGEYLSVSKKDGKVRYLGFAGE
ncbi:MAG: hypothetical protein MAG431_02461 [Chloroflexi bacterium]|nr:hypothetical protein [Chloroflexota bacterium]